MAEAEHETAAVRDARLSPVERRRRDRIASELDQRLRDLNEWYGLDNWPVEEVVQFVLERYDEPALPVRGRAAAHRLPT